MPPELKTMRIDGQNFRDLDHDGVLSPYEDHRLTPAERACDLLSRMTLQEKAGVMMHGTLRSQGTLGALGVGQAYDLEANRELIAGAGINHLITRLDTLPRDFAAQNNQLQVIAAQSRLGIPVTISTDPRHHFQHVTGASSRARGFSQWPETTGMAAIGSADLVREFAETARAEYRAVGIHMALSPQADIATEPRWSRIAGTFGEDPALARRLVQAYVEGMQAGSEGLTADGVSCVVKHWVGYPAAPRGFDGHNAYGRYSELTAQSLGTHIEAFLGAFEVKVAGVMPTYTILKDLLVNGELIEQVAGGFNRQLISDLLRSSCGFDGFVLSDWAIYKDVSDNTFDPASMQTPDDIAMPWGVESLTRVERFAKSIEAGMDQFGGEEDIDTLIEAVRSGTVSEQRINQSVYRMLVVKFRQGLFENPMVDEDEAAAVVGAEAAIRAGRDAQRRSLVCLKKPTSMTKARLHLVNFETTTGVPLDDADAAVIRLNSPSEMLHPRHFFGSRQQEGDIDFKENSVEFQTLRELAARLPVTAVIAMSRPAILTNLIDLVDGVYVDLGVAEDIVLEILTQQHETEAKLPFELPSSMESVEAQRSDLPADSENPLFALGSDYRSS
jgi:beta-glucosidase